MSYGLRLFFLCAGSFFVVNFAIGVVVRPLAPLPVRLSKAMGARLAATCALAMRLGPCCLGLVAVAGLCVPSYLRFEPDTSAERLGLLPIGFGALGAVIWLIAIARTTAAVVSTWRYNRRCCELSSQTLPYKQAGQLLVLESEAPLVATAGLRGSQLFVSRNVMRTLSEEEFDAAVRHETAHRRSNDNLKRLLVLLTPDILPFIRLLRSIELSWMRLTEWAADDEATEGDSNRAAALAAALLHVARLGNRPRLSHLHTSLVADGHDLAERVERLLGTEAGRKLSLRRASPTLPFATTLLMALLAALNLSPGVLASTHRMLEAFLRIHGR